MSPCPCKFGELVERGEQRTAESLDDRCFTARCRTVLRGAGDVRRLGPVACSPHARGRSRIRAARPGAAASGDSRGRTPDLAGERRTCPARIGVVAVDAPFGPGEPIGIGSLNSSISIRPPLRWSRGSGQNLGLVSMAPGRADSTSSSSHVPMCVGLSAAGPRSTPRESGSHHGLINEFEIWLQVGSGS